MNPYMCDFDYLADLSDDWQSQRQTISVDDNKLALFSEMRCTNSDYQRRLIESEIQATTNKIIELQNQMAIRNIMQCLNTLPIKPPPNPYVPAWCDCARTADGSLVREVIEVTTIGDRKPRYIYADESKPKPKIELKENQIIRDDWLIQQYPYPECNITLELFVAYAGEPNERKANNIEPIERLARERKQANDNKKPWIVRFLLFLIRVFSPAE